MIFVLQSEGKLFIMKGGVITGKRRTGMISIAIVEDEEMYAKQLQQFLHQYEKENKEMFDITVYSDGDQIVNKYKSQYDIILMDVDFHYEYGTICDQGICSGCVGLCTEAGVLFRIFPEA